MNKIAREQADLYQDFFIFLSQEHNLTCTIEEMDEIIHEAQTFVKKFDIANVVVPKGTLCCMCEKEKANIGYDMRFCKSCWNENGKA
ncbi:hypothetical protein [Winogradskyella sp.]|uniref:hypothetical protein n=1 Tax=Winogradskyella sp. TaxID=1883156 RepID=UPI0025E5E7D8|nr:hypothetical protein [Winogradskyella sp.]MBT8244554.1 hypothetical protein [Winogradskyella sp.]